LGTTLQKTPNIRALKALVIGMGVLIVVGLTIVVVTIAMRAADPEGGGRGAQRAGGAEGMTPAPSAAPRPRAFGELALGLADSCRIAGMRASAGTLVVRLDGPAQDGCQRLVVIDPAAGEVLGRIRPGAAQTEGAAAAPGQEDTP
jgi:hypothetical protein